MNQTLSLTRTSRPACLARREHLLEEYKSSGLSIADFTRKHDLRYQTFYAWVRKKGGQPSGVAKPKVCFAEVEVEATGLLEPLVVELGRQTRMRLSSAQQIGLAAQLIKELEAVC